MSRLKEYSKTKNSTFDKRYERSLFKLTEIISEAMSEEETPKIKLAAKLESSPAYITKLLNGKNNFEYKTLLRIAEALDRDLKIELTPKKVDKQNVINISGTFVKKNFKGANTVIMKTLYRNTRESFKENDFAIFEEEKDAKDY